MLTFHTPRENQGQIVVVSYAETAGLVIKEVRDMFDETITYWSSPQREDDQGDYWNHAPLNTDWTELSDAETDRLVFSEDDD